jgi:alpha-tubulin suppressor-like RCC1 family protein
MHRLGRSCVLTLLFTACAAGQTRTATLRGAAPWLLSPGIAVVDVAFGSQPCVLGRRGEVRCRAGRGEWSDVPLPAPATAIAASVEGTCALLADGRVHCWGCAAACGVTDAAASERATVDFTRLNPPPAKIIGIVVGASRACAWTRDGDQICWGDAGCERVGQEGYGYSATMSPLHFCSSNWINPSLFRTRLPSGSVQILEPAPPGRIPVWLGTDGHVHPDFAAPPGATARVVDLAGAGALTPMMNHLDFASSTGIRATLDDGHLCAVFETGEVTCWGAPLFRAAGYSITFSLKAVQVAVGERTACARSEDGTVRCWGRAAGDPRAPREDGGASSDVPREMPLPARAEVVRVAPGERDTACAVAAGTVACWGDPL